MRLTRLSILAFLLAFAGLGPVHGQSQFITRNLVCWDSAGVVTPLELRAYEVLGLGVRKEYRTLITDTKVVPTTGTVGDCGDGAVQSVLDSLLDVQFQALDSLGSIIANLEQSLVDNDTFILNQQIAIDSLASVIVNLELNLEDNDTVIVRLESVLASLDSLISNTQVPQQCDCTYVLDQDGINYEVTANSQFVTWNYDKVVSRNCGAGAEEIYRQPTAVVGTGKAITDYNTGGGEELSTGGHIDSILVFLANPEATLVVYLSPQLVWDNYPDWVSGGGDTTDLRFNSASPATLEDALESVIDFALNRYAALSFLPTPSRDQFCAVTAGGSVKIRFYVTHDPAGHYAAIDKDSPSRFFHFHQTASTTIASTRASITGITQVVQASYNLPCDTTVFTTYFDNVVDLGSSTWRFLSPTDPSTAALSGSLGTGTCQEDCNASECISICEMPEVVIQDAPWNGCKYRSRIRPGVSASDIFIIDANTAHTVTCAVVSGTVTMTYLDSGITQSYPTGSVIKATAKECEYLQTGLKFEQVGGTANVVISY